MSTVADTRLALSVSVTVIAGSSNVVSFSVYDRLVPVAVTSGGSSMVMVNVWTVLVSEAPFAVPPLSWMLTLTTAVPVASAADAKVSVPSAPTAG